MEKYFKKSAILMCLIFILILVTASFVSAADELSAIETGDTDENILQSDSDEDMISTPDDEEIITEIESTDLKDLEKDENVVVNLTDDYTLEDSGFTITNGAKTVNGNEKTIDANGKSLLFKVNSGATLTVNDLTIKNTYSAADAMIQNSGILILNNVRFTVERSIPATAGTYKTIENNREMIIQNSVFKDSKIYPTAAIGNKNMYVYGLISNNNDAKITIENTLFDNNKIYSESGKNFGKCLRVSLIHNANQMVLTNISLQNSYVNYTYHTSGTRCFNGIIFNEKGTLEINKSIIKNNTIDFPSYESYNIHGVINNGVSTNTNTDSSAKLIINNSIIIDNSHHQSNNAKWVINNGGDCDLENNYWGTNNPTFEDVVDIANTNTAVHTPLNFVILGFTPENTSVGVEKTFKITLNTLNTTETLLGTLPNYNITVNSKKLGNSIVEIKNGNGEYKYLATESGEDTITINSNEYPINIEDSKTPDFTVVANNVTYNDPLNITFNLNEGPQNYENYSWTIYDNNSAPIENGKINSEGKIIALKSYSAGKYTIKVVFEANGIWNYNENTVEFEVKKAKTNLKTSININTDNSIEINVIILSDNVKVNTNGTVTTVIDENYQKPIENGEATIKTNVLPVKKYTATITYSGNENYTGSSENITFTIKNIVSENAIESTNPTQSYSIKLPEGAKGNLTVIVDGKDTYTKSLENGATTVDIPKLTPGFHNITIIYTGDENYNNFTKNTNVTVAEEKAPDNKDNVNDQTKQKPKTSKTTQKATAKKTTKKKTIKKITPRIIAKNKKFKANKKVKKYTVTLKYGKKAVKKVKITLKIGKKIYKAKTNNKGKATFKIKKLTKKGKYKGTIKFNGTSKYNKVTKKVKITIKK